MAQDPTIESVEHAQTGRWKFTYRHQEMALGYLLVLPAVAVVVGIIGYPFVFAVWISFTDRMVGTPGNFIGLRNFEYLLKWPSFSRAVFNTVFLVVTSISVKLVLGLALAQLVNQRIRARWFFRGTLLVPWVMPAFVAYLAWRMLYAPLGGGINLLLTGLGIIEAPIDWLGSSSTALPAVVIADIWRGIPFFLISFLAGMQNIPQERYEAAAVDGATPWQRFWNITLPGIRHIVLVVVLLVSIWTSNTFTIIYIMTRGGPSDATTVFTMLSYQQAILNYRLGEGSAVSVAFLPILAVMIVVVARALQRDD